MNNSENGWKRIFLTNVRTLHCLEILCEEKRTVNKDSAKRKRGALNQFLKKKKKEETTMCTIYYVTNVATPIQPSASVIVADLLHMQILNWIHVKKYIYVH